MPACQQDKMMLFWLDTHAEGKNEKQIQFPVSNAITNLKWRVRNLKTTKLFLKA